MKFLVGVFVLTLIQFNEINSVFLTALIDEIVERELYFGLRFNTTRKDCKWRREIADDEFCHEDVKIYLYNDGHEELVDTSESDWLNLSSAWSPNKQNIFFLHGYAGGDNSPPLQVVRDAFVKSNEYNFFLVDYSPVSRAPCYVSLAYNIRYVSRCLATYLNALNDAGLHPDSITCIGHSMGAHICGQLKTHLKFTILKIIGLDPALPFISDRIRLKRKSAKYVHVIQTNAGFYGDIGSIGDVNVCVNNGNVQPFCYDSSDKNLCSHVWALCFMANSLFEDQPIYGNKCTKVCPHSSIFQLSALFETPNVNAVTHNDAPEKILIGAKISNEAHGSYCVTSKTPPFCPKYSGGIGDQKCCSLADMFDL